MSKTRTVILVLFVQTSVLFLQVPYAQSAPFNQKEKLILGFEQAELGRGEYISRQEKPGRQSWFYLLEHPKGLDFAARFEWPGATNRAWTWHCRKGDCTEGELALVTTIAPNDPEKQKATYQP